MALRIPDYIQHAGILDAPLRYEWPDVGPPPKFLGDERLANRIRGILPSGVAALSAASAEWIAWRLDRAFDNPVLLQYIEAVWAGIVDWRYLRSRHSVPGAPSLLKDWTGPVRGVVIKTCNDLDQVIRGVKKGRAPALSATLLSELALYVMPDDKAFKAWRRFAIARLASTYPGPEGEIGPPIPRDALNPAIDYNPSMAAELIARFLSTLDPAENPFLEDPAAMISDGFSGTPYHF